jgi:hypothetical protein
VALFFGHFGRRSYQQEGTTSVRGMPADPYAEIVTILEHGLPPLASPLVPEDGAAVAEWRGERHGCVLFTRAIKDGMDGDAGRLERQAAAAAEFDALVASGIEGPGKATMQPVDADGRAGGPSDWA